MSTFLKTVPKSAFKVPSTSPLCLFITYKSRHRQILPDTRHKKSSEANKTRCDSTALFVCISLRSQSLCERSIQYFPVLCKHFFTPESNFVYMHKTQAQFVQFIIHIHPIPHHHTRSISEHPPLLSLNFTISIIAHKFFTIFSLTSPHKCLIILSKLIN